MYPTSVATTNVPTQFPPATQNMERHPWLGYTLREKGALWRLTPQLWAPKTALEGTESQLGPIQSPDVATQALVRDTEDSFLMPPKHHFAKVVENIGEECEF